MFSQASVSRRGRGKVSPVGIKTLTQQVKTKYCGNIRFISGRRRNLTLQKRRREVRESCTFLRVDLHEESTMVISRIRSRLVVLFLVLLTLFSGIAWGQVGHGKGDFQANRALLLSYLLRQQLPLNHFSHKPIDDQLSKEAFGLFLKQLDSQKRFLLQKDVEELRTYDTLIDDELKSGNLELPKVAGRLLRERVIQARKMARVILAGKFDFSRKESLQTDPEKIDYCRTVQQLRERWRKTLKYQVLNRYLNLVEDRDESAKTAAKDVKIEKKSSEELRQEAREKILKRYEDFFTRMLEEKPEDHLDNLFNAIAMAYDPHTNYFAPATEEDFDIQMRGSLEGIGATLREEDGYIKVVSIIPGSAAARQGQLRPEDIILAVGQGSAEPVDITDTNIRDAVRLIRGKKGTEVRLTVKKPDGKHLVIPIVRDVVQIEDTFVKGADLRDKKNGKTFGYIKIPSFYRDFQKTKEGEKNRNATDDVRRELQRLKKHHLSGLILDLRNDGGGALTDAIQIAGLFIKTGPVVQVKNSTGKIEVLSDKDPSVDYSGPMVVLVNEFSASASEILAGALQDYGRAIIVGGARTHGKGTVQAMIDLDRSVPFSNMNQYKPLGALKITIQKFYRVTGESTQDRGVTPDIVLPDGLRYLKTGEKYLEYSLPWDTVTPTTFTKWPRKGIDLAAIKADSHRRVETEPAFTELAEEARLAKERSEQTRQSLNIADVRKERQEARQVEKTSGIPFHGSGMADSSKTSANMSEKEKRDLWIKDLSDDPYTDEAMAVLSDMLAEQSATMTAEKKKSIPSAVAH